MSLYTTVDITTKKACQHLGLPDWVGLHFITISEGILFYRENLLYTWDEQLQELTYDKVKELTQGLQLGEF